MATPMAGSSAFAVATSQSAISASPAPPCRKARSPRIVPSLSMMQAWWVSEPQSIPTKHSSLSMAFLPVCVPTGRHDAFRSLYWRSRRKLPTGRPSWPGTGAQVPPRCSRRRGRSVAPDPLARPARNGREPHDGRKPSQAAPAHRLPLRATRSGEADGRASLLLSEHSSRPSITTQPHRGRSVVRGTGGRGSAWDVAQASLFLASDAARFITGVALPVDGGVMARVG